MVHTVYIYMSTMGYIGLRQCTPRTNSFFEVYAVYLKVQLIDLEVHAIDLLGPIGYLEVLHVQYTQ
jgi:hypothetical protein